MKKTPNILMTTISTVQYTPNDDDDDDDDDGGGGSAELVGLEDAGREEMVRFITYLLHAVPIDKCHCSLIN